MMIFARKAADKLFGLVPQNHRNLGNTQHQAYQATALFQEFINNMKLGRYFQFLVLNK